MRNREERPASADRSVETERSGDHAPRVTVLAVLQDPEFDLVHLIYLSLSQFEQLVAVLHCCIDWTDPGDSWLLPPASPDDKSQDDIGGHSGL